MRQRILLPLWGLLCVGGLVCLWRMRPPLTTLNKAANAVAFMLMLTVSFSIVHYHWHGRREAQAFAGERVSDRPALPVAHPTPNTPQRDIYYLILDSYAGKRTLETMYGYDNRLFLTELTKRGFLIPPDSLSNYPITLDSVASSLNMTYNDVVAQEAGRGSRDLAPLLSRIRENSVMRFLEAQGYECLSVHSPADPPGSAFTDLLLQTTLWRSVMDNQSEKARQMTLDAFDTLAHLPPTNPPQRPRFVYAHIYCPHPPFVFGANGERVDTLRERLHLLDAAEIKRLYLAQLQYINWRTLELLDTLLKRSTVPPIILLQADHGTHNLTPVWYPTTDSLHERMHILNAFYLPGTTARDLPPNITPVNTFRFLFDRYFGTDLPLLPNENYYCTYRSPYDYLRVTERLR